LEDKFYKYSEEELLDLCLQKLSYFKRDKEYLSENGIEIDFLFQFESKIQKFKDMPDELDLENIISTTEKNKSSTRLEIIVLLRNIEIKARYAWGDNSHQYNDFQIKKVNSLKDIELLLFSRSVRVSSDIHFNSLVAFGLTKGLSNNLQKKNNEFYVSLTNSRRAIKFKDTTIKKRNIQSNELYELLIKYCDIAKTSSLIHKKENAVDYDFE